MTIIIWTCNTEPDPHFSTSSKFSALASGTCELHTLFSNHLSFTVKRSINYCLSNHVQTTFSIGMSHVMVSLGSVHAWCGHHRQRCMTAGRKANTSFPSSLQRKSTIYFGGTSSRVGFYSLSKDTTLSRERLNLHFTPATRHEFFRNEAICTC